MNDFRSTPARPHGGAGVPGGTRPAGGPEQWAAPPAPATRPGAHRPALRPPTAHGHGHLPPTPPVWAPIAQPPARRPAAPAPGVARPAAGSDPYADDPDLARDDRRSGVLVDIYCLTVIAGSFYGQVTGAITDLRLPWYVALFVVGALELGGIVVFRRCDVRRRLGEAAIGLMVLSLAVATVAAWVNYLTHAGVLRLVFPVLTGLAYVLYVNRTEARRRDRRRRLGHGKPLVPSYEIVGQWGRHPWLTLRARALAKQVIEAGDKIGRYESFAQARADAQRDRRDRVLTRRLRRNLGRAGALADAVYDSEVIAGRMRAQVDNEGVADRLMGELGIDTVASAALAALPPVEPPTARASKPPARKPRPPKPPAGDTPTQDDTARPDVADDPPAQRPKPAPKPPTPKPGGRADIRLVWSPTVRANAAELRRTFPGGLPTDDAGRVVVRRIRAPKEAGGLGWSKEKAKPAIDAYLAKADLDDEERHQTATG